MVGGAHQVCLLRCDCLWSDSGSLRLAVRDDTLAAPPGSVTSHPRTSSVAGICKVIIVFHTPVLLLWQVSAKLLLCFTLPYFFCGRYLQSYYCVLHSRTSSVAGICKVIILFYTPLLLLWQVSAKLLLCFTLPYSFCGRYLQSIIVFYIPVLLLWQVSAKFLL